VLFVLVEDVISHGRCLRISYDNIITRSMLWITVMCGEMAVSWYLTLSYVDFSDEMV